MPGLQVSVLEITNDAFPGWVACELRDASGLVHHFEEKWPVVSAEGSLPSQFPVAGHVRCRVISVLPGVDGVELLHVSTTEPDHVESLQGEAAFLVARSQVQLVREADMVWLAGMDTEKLPLTSAPVLVALAQKLDGSEISAECPYCGSAIQVQACGNAGSAWQHSCSCGRCDGTVRGL